MRSKAPVVLLCVLAALLVSYFLISPVQVFIDGFTGGVLFNGWFIDSVAVAFIAVLAYAVLFKPSIKYVPPSEGDSSGPLIPVTFYVPREYENLIRYIPNMLPLMQIQATKQTSAGEEVVSSSAKTSEKTGGDSMSKKNTVPLIRREAGL